MYQDRNMFLLVGNNYHLTHGRIPNRQSLQLYLIDAQAVGDMGKRMYPPTPGNITFAVNFPTYWKFAIGIFTASSGYTFPMELFVPGTDLTECESITKRVDVSILPKAIGGDATHANEETGEEDVYCCRGVTFPKLSTLLKRL